MVSSRGILAGIVVSILSVAALSQTIPPRQPRTIDPNRGGDPATRAWYEELRKRENVPTGIGVVDQPSVLAAAVAELRENARRKLGPTREEKRLFADFLKQPSTGLVRLAAPSDCRFVLDVANVKADCLNQYLPGAAMAFSFRKRDYAHHAYSDLQRLGDNTVVFPGTYVLGMISPLGDVPIETITTENPLVRDLAEFRPAASLDKVRDQSVEIANGKRFRDLTYRKSAALSEHSTYLLRSVAYRARFSNLPKTDRKTGSLDDDDRSDVIVVFRIVNKGADGTYLVLWRELKRIQSPMLDVDVANQ